MTEHTHTCDKCDSHAKRFFMGPDNTRSGPLLLRACDDHFRFLIYFMPISQEKYESLLFRSVLES